MNRIEDPPWLDVVVFGQTSLCSQGGEVHAYGFRTPYGVLTIWANCGGLAE